MIKNSDITIKECLILIKIVVQERGRLQGLIEYYSDDELRNHFQYEKDLLSVIYDKLEKIVD